MDRSRPWGKPTFTYSWRNRGNSTFTYSWRNRGNPTDYRPQTCRTPGSRFTRVDLDAKLYNGKDVEGIHLLTDFDRVRELQMRLGRFANGPQDFFAANCPIALSTNNIHLLTSRRYVVAPKPIGPRFLLYIDPFGEMFLENMTQNIFRVDEDHTVKMELFDGRSVTDTVLDGILTREKLNCDQSCNEEQDIPEKLTFVIQDAVRCNGHDLTDMGIVERVRFVKEEIIKPRLYALKNGKWSDENEAFNLDIAEYLEAYQTESYLCPEFEELYKYPMRAFVFSPHLKGYVCGTNFDTLQWVENDDYYCSFRLKIPKGTKDPKEGDLLVGCPMRMEMKWETIPLTDEIRNLDGCILEYVYADHHWVFVGQRLDRSHPNGRRAVSGKREAQDHQVSRDLLLTTLDQIKGFD